MNNPHGVRYYSGWCSHCSCEHRLDAQPAWDDACALMKELEEQRRLDYTVPKEQADPRFSTEYLYGPARGQMFGILTGMDQTGAPCCLRAFSGQYNGSWLIDGWTPPLFDVDRVNAILIPGDRQIKELDSRIKHLPPHDPNRRQLVRERRTISRELTKAMHDLYLLTNFRGVSAPLTDFFPHGKGIPTGTGDCCAPKLLNQAARLGIRPDGLIEFYWGLSNSSQTRHHGHLYPRCEDKCAPILGFMLCGISS